MNCHRCGGTMILKKFCDYGGYSCGWKCIICGEIIDEIPRNPQWLKEGGNENKNGRGHFPMTRRNGAEWIRRDK